MSDSRNRNSFKGLSSQAKLDSEIVCSCVDMTLSHLRDLLDDGSVSNFDQLLERTGAGKACTACLLDLEYYFSSHVLPSPIPGNKTMVRSVVQGQRRTLKRSLYGLLDEISPPIPFAKTHYMPVLFGETIEQWLWIANQGLLYQNTGVPTVRAGVLVRDSEGVERFRATRDLQEGETLRENLSRYLLGFPKPAEPTFVGIGSVAITLRALRPGKWGTTRPQVQIVTPVASCGVHSQGPNGQREQWFTGLYRPGHERLFFSVVNVRSVPLHVEAAYIVGNALADSPNCTQEITVPPLGTRFCEIKIPKERGVQAENCPLYLRWRCNGARKIHVFCATPMLDRFSIDHL